MDHEPIPPPIPGNAGYEEGEPDEDEIDGDDESTFKALFHSFSRQWLNTQLHHHVSLSAANSFWKLAFKYVSKIEKLKAEERIKSKIPQFLQVRKNFHANICPEVKMTYAFKNEADGSIIHVEDDHTPLNEFQRNPQYQKLYEEAHIEASFFIN